MDLFVAGIDDRIGQFQGAVTALAQWVGNGAAGAGLFGILADHGDFILGIGVEGVDADHRVDAGFTMISM